MLSLWDPTSWPEVQHLWLPAIGFFKILVTVLAIPCLWLTL